jgi:hypothetical protein
MEIQETIVNKVAASGLLTFDLAELYPTGTRVVLDIKDQLFHGLILREKDFRAYVKENDWSIYQDQHVAIVCSADAIVPTWAYMLLATSLQPYTASFVFGDLETLETILFERALQSLPMEPFVDQRVVLKGCGDIPVPTSAFVEFTRKVSEVAQSLFYGEPCSTVPVYKRKKV